MSSQPREGASTVWGGWHRRRDVLRAVFEGVCFSHLTHIDKLRLVQREREAFIAGGGKRSTVWTQMFADVLNTPIKIPEQDEPGVLGCAITAAVAAGVYPDHENAIKHMCHVAREQKPDPEAHSIYMKKYGMYKGLVDSMSQAWDTMHRTFNEMEVEFGGSGS